MVGDERREREDEEHLAELGRLEGERAEGDPAPGAVCGRADGENDAEQSAEAEVDHAPEPAVDRGVDQERRDEQDAAGADVEQLAAGGAPARVVAGDPADRPDPVGDDPDRGGEENEVDPADRADDPGDIVARAAPEAT